EAFKKDADSLVAEGAVLDWGHEDGWKAKVVPKFTDSKDVKTVLEDCICIADLIKVETYIWD
ncbi:hypothetical protein H310_15031, partial [Aphanomyces invadans]